MCNIAGSMKHFTFKNAVTNRYNLSTEVEHIPVHTQLFSSFSLGYLVPVPITYN